MLKLILKNVTPPAGFRYVDKDSGVEFTEMNLRDLTAQVFAHRVANKFPTDNLEAVIEDWICRQMPEGICNDGNVAYSFGVHRTAENSVNKTIGLWKSSRGKGRATQEEAERRAKICGACPHNIPFSGCSSCRGVKQIKREMLAGNEIKETKNLHSCRMTGVMNEVTVFVAKDVLAQTMKDSLVKCPETCWLKG